MSTQQLRAQIAVLQDATMDKNGNFCSAYDEGRFDALTAVDTLLDFLQEEPVSKDLEKAALKEFPNDNPQLIAPDGHHISNGEALRWAFKKGAQWQQRQFWGNLWEDGYNAGKKDMKNQMITKACDWLNTHDSYATPTNVMVEELRKYLEQL